MKTSEVVAVRYICPRAGCHGQGRWGCGICLCPGIEVSVEMQPPRGGTGSTGLIKVPGVSDTQSGSLGLLNLMVLRWGARPWCMG